MLSTEGPAVHGTVMVTDEAGNSASFDTADFKIDKTVPTVVSVLRWDPVAETTTATSVTFRITFSEDVQNLDAADVVFTGAAGDFATPSGLTPVTGSSVFDLTVDVPLWAHGALVLDLAPDVTIDDLAGNPLDTESDAGSVGD